MKRRARFQDQRQTAKERHTISGRGWGILNGCNGGRVSSSRKRQTISGHEFRNGTGAGWGSSENETANYQQQRRGIQERPRLGISGKGTATDATARTNSETANYQQRPRRGLGLSGTATDATAGHGWGWDPQRAPSRHGLGHKAGGHGHGSILQRSSVAVLADGSMPQWVFVAK